MKLPLLSGREVLKALGCFVVIQLFVETEVKNALADFRVNDGFDRV